MTVYIVSYLDEDKDYTVTAFDNFESAVKCRDYFKRIYGIANIDEVPVYSTFIEWE